MSILNLETMNHSIKNPANDNTSIHPADTASNEHGSDEHEPSVQASGSQKSESQASGNIEKQDGNQGIDVASLQQQIQPLFVPDELTVVCGALDAEKVAALAAAGVEQVINLQPDDELEFDEETVVLAAGMGYSQLPIKDAKDLKQLNMLEFDKVLRAHHGKKIAMHCRTGNRVGAAVALRAGWLRGRKMDTAMARGEASGLTNADLRQEVFNRLLVPR